MLQIKCIVLTLLFMGIFINAQNTYEMDSIEWILEDALQEEFITLDIAEIITPESFKNAYKNYASGNYRQALAILENLLELNLPDGRTDFISFMAAECYRMLNMKEKAKEEYLQLIKGFPSSQKVPAAYFRILQYAYEEKNNTLVDTIIMIFENNYKIHPLYNSVLYVAGKLFFYTERFGEAGDILVRISKASSRHYQGQFIAALSFLKLNNTDKALEILHYIRNQSEDDILVTEANLLIGDIHFVRGNYQASLPYYNSIRKDKQRYNYAQVKIARSLIKLKKYQKARDIAKPLFDKGRKTGYFFEIASILEEIYKFQDEKVKAARIKRYVSEQNINARLSFEVNEELIRLYEMVRSWREIEYYGLQKRDKALVREAHKNIKQIKDLAKKCRTVLFDIGAIPEENIETEVPGLAQQRYITLLRKNIARTQDSIQLVESELVELDAFAEKENLDSLNLRRVETYQNWISSSKEKLIEDKKEYAKLTKIYLESGSEADKFGREMQAKYVDWAFLRYLEKKNQLAEVGKAISRKRSQPSDTSGQYEKITDTTAQFAEPKVLDTLSDSTVKAIGAGKEMDREKLLTTIKSDRLRLIDHIETLLDASSSNTFTPQILFRLAELYFDEASEDFDHRLLAYEQHRDTTDDTTEIQFPEYDLDITIKVYDSIINNYSQDWIADDALFFKALAIKKTGNHDQANQEFERLVEKYPESEYYVEANMNIGRYYFDNPTIRNNQGYQLAEEAYRRVLAYNEHPQFVHAIYHLGWCYYMQDQYDDAILVFKYLVEETELDFDLKQGDEKQVLNPLLREEAVDYIAISFDERDNLDGAIQFLNLIGNLDYAAIVLKRIGELREEDIDYQTAIQVYNRLIKEFPLSSTAPRAAENLIKIYESNNDLANAMAERELFFKRFARGSEWHTKMLEKDTLQTALVDSMTIAIGLYVADALYREAEKHHDKAYYNRAMKNYQRLIAAYPNDPNAAEALWNIAIILDQKLQKKENAYKAYISFSQLERISEDRREQASLNAISLAQQMIPTDASIDSGKLDIHALRVIEAAENYLKLFPTGKMATEVVMNIGSIYYNRKMFFEAISTYQIITKQGNKALKYYDAGLFIAKCYFGEENWIKASRAFAKVWRESSDESQKKEAYKLLLQAKFLYAKNLYDEGKYIQAANEYRNIDRQYPGSEYGDITLFNSAEAFEKSDDMAKSCKVYYELFESYPNSKLAPEALFNAAINYDKIKMYNKSADLYELIVSKYPTSDKAKDALFNVGFSYEKLGKLEKMAHANERFTKLYPGEKDVELMILRSAQFYYKSQNYEKSITVYRNYIIRYPNKNRTVEAYYYIGKCYQAMKDMTNSFMAFDQAESHNKRLQEVGLQNNNYFASMAAMAIGELKKKEFSRVSFAQSPKLIEEKKKIRTELLAAALKAFQRVMQYQSEKMFEAACAIGEMYSEYAYSWSKQKLTVKDPIQAALAQKEIYFTSASLLKKAFEPYKKVIGLSQELDSLSKEQQSWVDSAKVRYGSTSLGIGKFMIDGISAMQKAPIPDQIKKQTLYLFQYRKQLLETLEPVKGETRDYYLSAYNGLNSLNIAEKEKAECLNKFNQINFLIPNEYERLAGIILASSEKLPKSLSEEEREELIFQFEDIIFELQDKALFGYEDALALAEQEGLKNSRWYSKILERLARLSPETYGKSFYASQTFQTDYEWIAHSDSMKYWNASDPPEFGWKQVQMITGNQRPEFTVGDPQVIWGDKKDNTVFLWRNAFVNGSPRDATIYLACYGKYRLYINEKLLSVDTSHTRSIGQLDSISSITKLLRGGDNIIALEVTSGDSSHRGVALVLSVLVDTSDHFKSTALVPKVEKKYQSKVSSKTPQLSKTTSVSSPDTTSSLRDNYAQLYKNKGEMLKAIKEFQDKEQNINLEIRKERLEVQKLNIKIEAIDDRLAEVKKEIENLRKQKSTLTREK